MSDLRAKILWWAALRRIRRDQPTVIAVGGAIAKTSTKAAIGQLLSLAYPGQVRTGFGNLNTYLGVPLSILDFEVDFHSQAINAGQWLVILIKALNRAVFGKLPLYLVLEYGTDRPGDVEAIAAKLPPTIGVVTIVGPAHLANYPNVEALVKDESSLAAHAKELLFVNSSDPYLTIHHTRTKARVINVVTPLEEIAVRMMIAFGQELGISQNLIDQAQAEFKRPSHRLNLEMIGHWTILDDSYNASPLSMQAALNELKKFSGRKVAVLGSMKELGSDSVRFHREIGRAARQVADTVIAVGEEARDYGADHYFLSSEELKGKIFDYLNDADTILIKGSRAVQTEKIVEAIKAHELN